MDVHITISENNVNDANKEMFSKKNQQKIVNPKPIIIFAKM